MFQETAKDVIDHPLKILECFHLKILRSDRTLHLAKER